MRETGYHLLKLQLPKDTYEFFDLPMPKAHPTFPSCDQVLWYLNEYARYFNVINIINFNCIVKKLVRDNEKNLWIVNYFDQQNNLLKQKKFDFIITCHGLYSKPNIPAYPNQENFKGEILHTSDFQQPKQAEQSSIVVVGFGKSALDTVKAASKYTKDVTLLYRKPHWPLPIKLFNFFPTRYTSKFISSFIPLYITPSSGEKNFISILNLLYGHFGEY